MAKDPKAAEDSEPAAAVAAPSKKKKLLIIIIALVLLVVVGLGVGVTLLLLKPDPEELDGDEEITETVKSSKQAEKKDELPPIYIPLEAFTVNLVPETGEQYLRVQLSLECTDPLAESQIKTHMPRILNGITLLLSSKKSSELSTREGKTQLASEIKDLINALFPQKAPAPKKGKKHADEEPPELIRDVLFTSFIIQ